MSDHTMYTDNDTLPADVADLEESLYEFHLRLRDLVELYRRAAVIHKHLRA